MRRANYRFYAAIFVFILALGITTAAILKKSPEKALKKKVSYKKQEIIRKASSNKEELSPKTKSVLISAVGDVMFDRRVKAAVVANGANWPFSKVTSFLKADLTIVNLESPLAEKGTPTKGKDVVFKGTPKGINSLKYAGIDIVALANNHALDFGLGSLNQTRALLKKAGIRFSGAGANKQEAYKPAIAKVGDLKVGFLSFSDVIPFNSFPTSKLPGIAPARDPAKVASKIKSLSKKVHIVIVAFHWGKEYEDYPTGKQKELATTSIDAGADLVLGHHPHVTQGIAEYKNRLIIYSLGNFVFDHFKVRTGESIILRVELNSKGEYKSARIWPVIITYSGQPYVVKGSEAKRVLERFKAISGKFSKLLVDDKESFLINNKSLMAN